MYGEAGEGGGRARGDGGKEERFLTEGLLERFSKEADVSWAMSSPVAKK